MNLQFGLMSAYNKAMKNRPQKTWAGLGDARLLLRRYISGVSRN